MSFQLPQSREEFMLFVQQVAREDVKKCLAGVSTTHPELIQQFVVTNQPSTTISSSPQPITPITTVKPATLTQLPNTPPSTVSQQPVCQATPKHQHHQQPSTNPSSPPPKPKPKQPQISPPSDKKQVVIATNISERLLKPTISMQKKFEKEKVNKHTKKNDFKELRTKQHKSTSLLLHRSPPSTNPSSTPPSTPKQQPQVSPPPSTTNNTNTSAPTRNDRVEQEITVTNINNISEISPEPSISIQQKLEKVKHHNKDTNTSIQSIPQSSPQSTSPPQISPKRSLEQPLTNSISSISTESVHPNNLQSNNTSSVQYDKLEEMVIDDLLKELAREEHFATKKRAEQEIKLIEKKSQQNDKYDEILNLLNQLEQDEHSIRKRFSNKNYLLLDSTQESTIVSEDDNSSLSSSAAATDEYDGLGIENVKLIQKFKRRNKKYFEAFCRPHDLSIETLMQVIGEDILKEVIFDVCDEFSDAMSDIVRNTAAHEFGMNETTTTTISTSSSSTLQTSALHTTTITTGDDFVFTSTLS